MPTYDYICEVCDHEFEIFQSMTAALLKKCPSCNRMGLRRLIGAGAGIIFKGSGFYETDYKRPANNSTKPSAENGDSAKKSLAEKSKITDKKTKKETTSKTEE
ncbi:MAG: zinc ribbon domain-containing protein [Candidatus Marinimicrobia bacterium]|nr:zinc ribbon domain-containing protein [Candidatus Neomarinimicrobiota bacterium]